MRAHQPFSSVRLFLRCRRTGYRFTAADLTVKCTCDHGRHWHAVPPIPGKGTPRGCLAKGCECCCYDPRRISQAKDVPEAVILHALSKRPGEWHVQDGDGSIMPSITAEAPELLAFPSKVLRRKLGAMARKRLIYGCDCGCRGDWHVPLGTDNVCACGCGERRKR